MARKFAPMKFGRSRRQSTLSNLRSAPRIIDDDQRRYMEIVCPTSGSATFVQEGLEAYVNYVGDQMLQYEKGFSDMLNVISAAHTNTSFKEGRMFDLSATIASLVRTALVADPQTSMDTVVSRLFEHYGIRPEHARKLDSAACQITFATFGWISMFFQPMINLRGSEFRTSSTLEQGPILRGQSSRITQRPITAMLRALNALPVLCGLDKSSLAAEQVLLVSSVSYNTLRHVGKVKIIWIDDLTKHGEFTLSRRQLKLFRWPSFCIQAYERSDASLLNIIHRAHSCPDNCATSSESRLQGYLLEVIQSYRLIFGQDKISRQLYKKFERDMANYDGFRDPLLDVLCGTKEIPVKYGLKGYFRDRGVYDLPIAFPYLGRQLADLRKHNMEQHPRELSELWKDRRNPVQFFAFWATIIIGGLSLFLSLVQALLSIGQLVISIRALPPTV